MPDNEPMIVVIHDAQLAEWLGIKPVLFDKDGNTMPLVPLAPAILMRMDETQQWLYWPVIEGALDNGA